jgi:glycine/D-amino acid oxidase-like deaminating enzyme
MTSIESAAFLHQSGSRSPRWKEVPQRRPDLRMGSYGVGPKPIPGDGDPILGQVPRVKDLFVAFNHSGGATLGLIAGELLADEILDASSTG